VLQRLPIVFKGKQIVVEPLSEVCHSETNANGTGVDNHRPTMQIRGVRNTTSLQSVEKYFETKTTAEATIESVVEDQEGTERVIYLIYSHEKGKLGFYN